MSTILISEASTSSADKPTIIGCSLPEKSLVVAVDKNIDFNQPHRHNIILIVGSLQDTNDFFKKTASYMRTKEIRDFAEEGNNNLCIASWHGEGQGAVILIEEKEQGLIDLLYQKHAGKYSFHYELHESEFAFDASDFLNNEANSANAWLSKHVYLAETQTNILKDFKSLTPTPKNTLKL